MKSSDKSRSLTDGVNGIVASFSVFRAAVQGFGQLLQRQIQNRLDAATDVHESEGDVVDITAEDIRREILSKGKESNRREVVKHNDGQDDEDHLEGLLLGWVSLVSTWSLLSQSPENGDVTEEHERKRHQDHDEEHLLEVRDVSYTLGCSVDQSDKPEAASADGTMPLVFDFGESDGMPDSHISVQTDTGQEERRQAFDAIEEAQDIPGAAGGQVDDVGQLQWRTEAEERVQNSQMDDEDI